MKIVFSLIVFFSFASAKSQDCNTSVESNMTWQTMSEAITSGQVKSIEEFLCFLPRGLRSHYSFVAKSRSLQKSDPTNPRVILFDNADPTRIMMTFNGKEDHRGYNSLEVIRRTDYKKGEIEFFEVNFDPAGEAAATIEHNPVKCMNCHGTRISGTDARLMFDSNPLWEDFYGSGEITRAQTELHEEENTNFNSFKENALTHARYKHLVGLQEKVPNRQDLPEGASPALVLENLNKRFTMHIAHLNRYRKFRILQESKYYNEYKYALVGTLKCGLPGENFLPEELRAWHNNESWLVDELKGVDLASLSNDQKTKILSRMDEANGVYEAPTAELDEYIQRAVSRPLLSLSSKFLIDSHIKQGKFNRSSDYTARWRYLLEGRREPVSMAEWNIDLDIGFYRFNNLGVEHSGLLGMRPILAEMDPEIAAVEGHLCEQLIALSKERLATVVSELELEQMPAEMTQTEREMNLLTGPAVQATACAHCHMRENQRQAPRMDFTNRMMIAATRRKICKTINTPVTDPKHMPKFMHLEKSQVDSLFLYFKSVHSGFRCNWWEGPASN